MITSWTDGVDETRQTEIKQNFKEAAVMRRRLVELLQKKIATNVIDTRQKVNYEKPSWPYQQADAHGYQRAIAEIIELVQN